MMFDGITLRLGHASVSLLACTGLLAGACTTNAREPVEATTATQADFAVVTLGTAGGPPPHVGRSQPATLLVLGDRQYLVDAGEGTGYQLMQVGVQSGSLDAVFLSHLHWDHTLGLDYIMASDWMRNRTATLPVFGPAGTEYFVSRAVASVEVGQAIFRAQAQYRPPLANLYPAQDIADCAEHEVYRDDAVVVRAVCNSHFAKISAEPHPYGEDTALSYRFDTAFGSVTVTGDTGPSTEIAELARGSDVLVSEIVDLPSIGRALERASGGSDIAPLLEHMAHQHLTPEAVGQLATDAGVRTVILTHFVVGEGADLDEIAEQVRAHFTGEVLVGHDLQRFPVANRD